MIFWICFCVASQSQKYKNPILRFPPFLPKICLLITSTSCFWEKSPFSSKYFDIFLATLWRPYILWILPLWRSSGLWSNMKQNSHVPHFSTSGNWVTQFITIGHYISIWTGENKNNVSLFFFGNLILFQLIWYITMHSLTQIATLAQQKSF